MKTKLSYDYEHYASTAELPEADRTLVAEAERATRRSHAPYSKFRVGAAARLASGKVLHAGNFESEVFPAGLCAERSLLFYVQTNFPDDPIETTLELVDVIRGAMPDKALREKQHPAKRSFQAIRIAVNDELGAVREAMEKAIDCLNPGGRLAVITFHSLEDRIVKAAFNQAAQGCTCPKDFPVCVCGKKPKVRLTPRKPILPSDEEIEENPRARSAKLRVCEKI